MVRAVPFAPKVLLDERNSLERFKVVSGGGDPARGADGGDPARRRRTIMAERALRGSRLGATSLEDDRDIELAPRMLVVFDCPAGHQTRVPMAAEADVPPRWECAECGAVALLRGGVQPVEKPKKPARTHWDMLLERRTIADLEELLAERLELLHGPTTKRSA
jgi:hypothetical protein